MKNFPEPSWEEIKNYLENQGFVEVKFPENWYVFMKKRNKNIRIPKLKKISKICLDSIIQASDIDEEKFITDLKIKK